MKNCIIVMTLLLFTHNSISVAEENAGQPLKQDSIIEKLKSSDTEQKAKTLFLIREDVSKIRSYLPYLVDLLSDDSPVKSMPQEYSCSVGSLSAITLSQLKEEAIGPFSEVLKKSKDETAKINVMSGFTYLVNLKVNIPTETLAVASKDTSAKVRSMAAATLSHSNDTKAVEILIKLLKDDSYSVRLSSVKSLEILASKGFTVQGETGALAGLIGYNDEEEYIQRGAAATVGKIAELGKIDYIIGPDFPLAKLLDTHSGYLRMEVEKALIKIGAPGVDSVITMLRYPSWTTKQSAAEVLGELKDKRAVGPLIEVLNEKGYNVEWAWPRVAEALTKITGENFGTDYEKWKNWQELNK